jgi:glycine/D-amino acid oxidase-like deaminating enzyme
VLLPAALQLKIVEIAGKMTILTLTFNVVSCTNGCYSVAEPMDSYTANVSQGGSIDTIKKQYEFEKAAQRCITQICKDVGVHGHDVQLRPSTYVLPGVKGQEKYMDEEERVTRLIGDEQTKQVERLTGEQVTSLLKSKEGYYTTGLRLRDSIALHPLRLVYAMIAVAHSRGVMVHERTCVTRIDYDQQLATSTDENVRPITITLKCITTSAGASSSYTSYVKAKNIVVATNGYVGNIRGAAIDELRYPGMVAHSCLMSTAPLTRQQADSIGLTPVS